MASGKMKNQDGINHLIDENLKKVFTELKDDQMPSELIDLLSVLRAQDQNRRSH